MRTMRTDRPDYADTECGLCGLIVRTMRTDCADYSDGKPSIAFSMALRLLAISFITAWS